MHTIPFFSDGLLFSLLCFLLLLIIALLFCRRHRTTFMAYTVEPYSRCYMRIHNHIIEPTAKSTFSMVYGLPTSIWSLNDSCVLISWIFLCCLITIWSFLHILFIFFLFIRIAFYISLSSQR